MKTTSEAIQMEEVTQSDIADQLKVLAELELTLVGGGAGDVVFA